MINYFEIIFIHWAFNFMYFIGYAIYKFEIPMKYLFNLANLCKILKAMNSN